MMYQNGIYMECFPVKKSCVSRTQEVCHVIDIFLESSLGKI